MFIFVLIKKSLGLNSASQQVLLAGNCIEWKIKQRLFLIMESHEFK